MDRIEGPWCRLGECVGEPAWRTTADISRPFACDDFWQFFEWNRPEKGQELRFVISSKYVKNAQKTLVRNDMWGRVIIIPPRTDFGMYIGMQKLLKELEPRELSEFYVWWWPEYREEAA